MDDECQSGFYCTMGGACVQVEGAGKSCGGNDECTSDLCLGTFCCNTMCTTGGTCGATACLTGSGDCVYPSSQCAAPGCVDGAGSSSQTAAADCTMGTCPTVTPTSCGAYKCSGTVCGTSCTTGTECWSGVCLLPDAGDAGVGTCM
jgi:hypothetical protein